MMEVSANIKDPKGTRVVGPSCIRLIGQSDLYRKWVDLKNDTDFHKPNRAVNRILVTLSDTVCWLDQVHMAPGTYNGWAVVNPERC